MTEDEKFMKAALAQAKKAAAIDEVPIGCVIVYEGKIIARGYNKRNKEKNTLSHAEMNAIRKASKYLGDWRLEGCTMYITLEPCPMCRSDCSGPRGQSGDRQYECQGRLCGISAECAAGETIQSSGGDDEGCAP